MPVSVARSLVIIAAVAGTIFYKTLPVFILSAGKTDPACDTVPWKGAAARSDRDAGDLLLKGGKYYILSIWASGVYIRGSGDTASCLETKQPA